MRHSLLTFFTILSATFLSKASQQSNHSRNQQGDHHSSSLHRNDGRRRTDTSPTPSTVDAPDIDFSHLDFNFDPKPKVINGDEVDPPFNYPWMCRIIRSDSDKTWCGGSLVHPEWILTCAHCIQEDADPEDYQVECHRHDLSKSPRDENAIVVSVDRFEVHPDYDGHERTYDVALWHLHEPIYNTDLIRINAGDHGNEGNEVLVLGWGDTDDGDEATRLQEGELEIVDCDSTKFADDDDGPDQDLEFCAGEETSDGVVDSCMGDSGGPAFDKDARPYVQVGLVSWGRGCAEDGYPGVYVKLDASDIYDWIQDEIPNALYDDPSIYSYDNDCVTAPYFWQDGDSAICEEYESAPWCFPDGSKGPLWQASWGEFDDWEVDGIDASEACCACGGGREPLCDECAASDCEILDLPVIESGGKLVCCASQATNDGGCSGEVDYEEAVKFCRRAGMRLCTRWEIEDGVCIDSGCGYDSRRIWTSTTSGCNRRYYMTVDGLPDTGTEPTCTHDSEDDSLFARCCSEEDIEDCCNPPANDDPNPHIDVITREQCSKSLSSDFVMGWTIEDDVIEIELEIRAANKWIGFGFSEYDYKRKLDAIICTNVRGDFQLHEFNIDGNDLDDVVDDSDDMELSDIDIFVTVSDAERWTIMKLSRPLEPDDSDDVEIPLQDEVYVHWAIGSTGDIADGHDRSGVEKMFLGRCSADVDLIVQDFNADGTPNVPIRSDVAPIRPHDTCTGWTVDGADGSLNEYQQILVIDPTTSFDNAGWLSFWTVWCAPEYLWTEEFYLQVWRPTSTTVCAQQARGANSDSVECTQIDGFLLVGQTPVECQRRGAMEEIFLDRSDQIQVEAGDILGVQVLETPGVPIQAGYSYRRGHQLGYSVEYSDELSPNSRIQLVDTLENAILPIFACLEFQFDDPVADTSVHSTPPKQPMQPETAPDPPSTKSDAMKRDEVQQDFPPPSPSSPPST